MKSASSREMDRSDFSQPKFGKENYGEGDESSLDAISLDGDGELKELSFGDSD